VSGSPRPWDIGPIGYPERSVPKYQPMPRDVKEVGRPPSARKPNSYDSETSESVIFYGVINPKFTIRCTRFVFLIRESKAK